MFYLKIILGILGLVPFIDGLVLILYGKIHLGTVLPLLIGGIFLLHAFYWQRIQVILQQHLKLKRLWQILWGTFAVWCFSVLVFVWILKSNIQDTQHIPAVKAIIVLGSGTKDGQPLPALANRLHTAATIMKSQPQALSIMSGGVDFAEKESEAVIMARFLQQHYQLTHHHILLEEHSTSTELNLKNSREILQQHQISIALPIAIVTSDFHTLRSWMIAKKQGYQQAIMVAAPTPLSIRYNAWLREYFAFLSGLILREY